MTAKPVDLFEVEAFGHLKRAKAHHHAFSTEVAATTNALRMSKDTLLLKQSEQLEEFARLISMRVDGLRRRLGEGGGS